MRNGLTSDQHVPQQRHETMQVSWPRSLDGGVQGKPLYVLGAAGRRLALATFLPDTIETRPPNGHLSVCTNKLMHGYIKVYGRTIIIGKYVVAVALWERVHLDNAQLSSHCHPGQLPFS